MVHLDHLTSFKKVLPCAGWFCSLRLPCLLQWESEAAVNAELSLPHNPQVGVQLASPFQVEEVSVKSCASPLSWALHVGRPSCIQVAVAGSKTLWFRVCTEVGLVLVFLKEYVSRCCCSVCSSWLVPPSRWLSVIVGFCPGSVFTHCF